MYPERSFDVTYCLSCMYWNLPYGWAFHTDDIFMAHKGKVGYL